MRMSSHSRRWLRGLISVGLLIWLIRWIDWREFGHLAAGFRYHWGLAASILYAANILMTSYKWRILLREKGLVYRWSRLVRIVWVGNFLGTFLPTSLGGDNVRMVSIVRTGSPPAEAISSVVMERVSGMCTLGALAVLGGLWSSIHWQRPELLLMIVLPASIVTVGLLLVWSEAGYRLVRWITNRLRGLPGQRLLVDTHEALRSYDQARGALTTVFAVSFLAQFLRVAIVMLIARGFGIHLPLLEAMALIPTALFLGALPISVGGWGVREGALVLFLGLAGVGPDAAFGVSLISRAAALLAHLPGLVIYSREGFGSRAERDERRGPGRQ